jgi:hypothetical protein
LDPGSGGHGSCKSWITSRYGTFRGAEFAPGDFFTTYFGKRLSPKGNRESILESLAIIAEWCQLHLPDKFLERYEAAL